MMQYKSLNDTLYFWFASNDTSGSGADGASPISDIRLAGAATTAAPVYSPTPALLTDAGYAPGTYELAIAATGANGFATGNTYAVFCSLLVDTQNPVGFVGAFTLDDPILSNVQEWLDTTPNVLQTGRVDVRPGAMATGVLTANAFAAGAIDASAIGTGAIDANAIQSAAFTNAKFATDCIGADELAADGLAEIADTILKRDIDNVEATMALHSLGTAVLKSVSKVEDDAGTLKVYRTNGSTLHLSQTIATNPSADPIDSLTVGV